MGYGLAGKTRMELAEYEVSQKRKRKEADYAAGKMEIPHKDYISDRTHGTEACSLRKHAYEKCNCK
jgi:hypothetical protein